jgi:hypothetical protein
MPILLSVLLLLAARPLAAQTAAQPDAEQSKILALENAWNLAEEHKDVKALETLLDSSLVYVDYDGTLMDKGQFIASVKQTALHPEQIVNESMTAHVYGGSAIVTGVYREKGVNQVSHTRAAADSRTRGCITTMHGCAWPANRR